jgi:hypothetical protein
MAAFSSSLKSFLWTPAVDDSLGPFVMLAVALLAMASVSLAALRTPRLSGIAATPGHIGPPGPSPSQGATFLHPLRPSPRICGSLHKHSQPHASHTHHRHRHPHAPTNTHVHQLQLKWLALRWQILARAPRRCRHSCCHDRSLRRNQRRRCQRPSLPHPARARTRFPSTWSSSSYIPSVASPYAAYARTAAAPRVLRDIYQRRTLDRSLLGLLTKLRRLSGSLGTICPSRRSRPSKTQPPLSSLRRSH